MDSSCGLERRPAGPGKGPARQRANLLKRGAVHATVVTRPHELPGECPPLETPDLAPIRQSDHPSPNHLELEPVNEDLVAYAVRHALRHRPILLRRASGPGHKRKHMHRMAPTQAT